VRTDGLPRTPASVYWNIVAAVGINSGREKCGWFLGMVVGTSGQLMTDVPTPGSEPYSYPVVMTHSLHLFGAIVGHEIVNTTGGSVMWFRANHPDPGRRRLDSSSWTTKQLKQNCWTESRILI